VPHLELENISKQFGGVRALADVSLAVTLGTVHAIVGENGAGKSTLGRIVAGVLSADGGRMLLDGAPASFRSPRDALDHGVAAIAQDPSLVPQLTVAENVYLGAEPRRRGFIRRRALGKAYAELAAQAGFDLPGHARAGALRTADQQKAEIMRALSRDARIIVMDEPSAALSAPETAHLHDVVRTLAQRGRTILLISHFLREVLELADSVTVLRDGRAVRTSSTSDETEASLVEAMLGRPLTTTFPPKRPVAAAAQVALTVRDVHAAGVAGVSFDVRAGEIVGVAGLVGAGRTELARAIFGAARIRAGEALVAVDVPVGKSPRRSLDAGVALVPESRHDQGLIFGRSVIENVTLAQLDDLSRLGVVSRRAERRSAARILDRCEVRGASYSAPVSTLSGGNQQKVLFARTLLGEPRVLLADEPTRGVDVGAKRAIYELLVSLAEAGTAIVLISSELEEILGLAHRVLVMRQGAIVAELQGDDMTESAVLAAAFAEGRAA
jgi:simple sugar transport system ATP-binding protein/ribose transport system ATP-binding protein